jgi:hypothetical protein
MDRQKAGRPAAKYKATATRTPFEKLKETLFGRADVFRFIDAILGGKTASLEMARQAVAKAVRRRA